MDDNTGKGSQAKILSVFVFFLAMWLSLSVAQQTKLISSFSTSLRAVIFVVGAVMSSAGFDYGCLW